MSVHRYMLLPFADSWHEDEKTIWKQSRRHLGMSSTKRCLVHAASHSGKTDFLRWRRVHVSSALLISLVYVDTA